MAKLEAIIVAVILGVLGFFVLSRTTATGIDFGFKLPVDSGVVLSAIFALVIASAVYSAMEAGRRRS